jgi:DeoR family transcriptional regulator, fructose operon transcriptional repressor
MSLSFSVRKNRILEQLEKTGFIKVRELAIELDISEITIRRDLDRLDREGFLVKTHGGALKRDVTLNEYQNVKQIREKLLEKERIGRAAAEMVKLGDVVFLDTGTTTLQIAHALIKERDLTIVTNSILILSELRFIQHLDIILLGGSYRPGTFALGGPLAENALQNFRAKYAFLGADGITMKDGVTTNDIYTAQITRLMMRFAEKKILVSDHSKIGRMGSIKYANISDFDMLITDSGATNEEWDRLQNSGLTIRSV